MKAARVQLNDAQGGKSQDGSPLKGRILKNVLGIYIHDIINIEVLLLLSSCKVHCWYLSIYLKKIFSKFFEQNSLA